MAQIRYSRDVTPLSTPNPQHGTAFEYLITESAPGCLETSSLTGDIQEVRSPQPQTASIINSDHEQPQIISSWLEDQNPPWSFAAHGRIQRTNTGNCNVHDIQLLMEGDIDKIPGLSEEFSGPTY